MESRRLGQGRAFGSRRGLAIATAVAFLSLGASERARAQEAAPAVEKPPAESRYECPGCLVPVAPGAEITAYSAELAAKPHCVVFTKLDLFGEHYVPEIETRGAFGVFSISAAGRLGLDELRAAWWEKILELKKARVVLKNEFA